MISLALNKLARNTIFYGIGGVMQRFMGLLLLPFLTAIFTPYDYGIVSLISLVSVAMSGLLSMGTGNSMGLLYFLEKDIFKRPTIIWTNLLLVIITNFFWFGVIFFLAPKLSEWLFKVNTYADLIRLAFLGTALMTIYDPLLAYLRMEEKAKKYVLLTLINSLTNILLTVLFVIILELGLFGFFLSIALSQALMLILCIFFIGRHLSFAINFHMFHPLVRIGFPTIFGLFAFFIINNADRYLIEHIVGLSDLGIYSLGATFGMMITIVMSAFSIAWPPFFSSYVNKRNEAEIIFGKVLTYYVLGFGSLIVVFFFMAKPIISLMTAEPFHGAWSVVGLVAAAHALKGCYLITQVGICFAQKLSLISLIDWIVAIINIVLNLILIPTYGITGAAVAMFLSYLIMPILAWSIAQRYLRVKYEWRRVGITLIVTLLTSGLLFYVNSKFDMEQLNFLYLNALIFIIFLWVTFNFLLTKSERDNIRAKICYEK